MTTRLAESPIEPSTPTNRETGQPMKDPASDIAQVRANLQQASAVLDQLQNLSVPATTPMEAPSPASVDQRTPITSTGARHE